MNKIIWALLISAAVSGCTTYQQGNDFDFNCMIDAKSHVTTKQQLIACLGIPAAESISKDGTQYLNWTFVRKTSVGETVNKRLTVEVDKEDKFIRITNRVNINSVGR